MRHVFRMATNTYRRSLVNNTGKTLIGCFILHVLLLVWPVQSESAERVPVSGKVMFGDTPLCAMVIANGQNMFSCSGDGSFNLSVPLDANGEMTVMAFAQGFAPFRQTITPAGAAAFSVDMVREPTSRKLTTLYNVTASERSGWALITGTIDFNGTPVCALLLANGQHSFSCDADLGQFSLQLPLDSQGNVALFAFVSGFQPFKVVFAGPAQMTIAPTAGLNASGQQGGPFSPSSLTYRLSNTGGKTLNYVISNSSNWLTLTDQGDGVLSPGETTGVVASLNSLANTLAAGDYTDAITFRNIGTGSIMQRPVDLTVAAPPAKDGSGVDLQVRLASPDIFEITWTSSGVSTSAEYNLWLYVGGPDQWQHVFATDESSFHDFAGNGVGNSYCFKLTAIVGPPGPPWPPDGQILAEDNSGNKPPCGGI